MSERKVIDGKTYIMAKYMVVDGLELLTTLKKTFAKPLGIMVGGFVNGMKENNELSVNSLMNADVDIPALFESLLEKLEPKEVVQLARDILRGTKVEVNGELQTVDINLHFIGDYLGLFKLLGAVLAYQYADFLGGLFAKAKSVPVANENRIKARPI